MRVPVIVLLAAILFTGCVGPEPEDSAASSTEDSPPAAPPAPPTGEAPAGNETVDAIPSVSPTSGTVGMSVIGVCVIDDGGSACLGVTGDSPADVALSGASAAATFDFAWTAATPETEEMQVWVEAGDRLYTATGPSPLQIRIDELPRGSHTVGAAFVGTAGTGLIAGPIDQEVAWTVALDG